MEPRVRKRDRAGEKDRVAGRIGGGVGKSRRQMVRLHVDQPDRTGSPPSLHVARSFYGAALLATNCDPQ